MMVVNTLRVMLNLPGLDLFKQVFNLFMVGQRHLDAHSVQTLDRGLPHATTDQKLTILYVFEFGHVGRVISTTMMVSMIMIVVVMIVIAFAALGQRPELLIHDLIVLKGHDQKCLCTTEMARDGRSVISWNCDFDSHQSASQDTSWHDPHCHRSRKAHFFRWRLGIIIGIENRKSYAIATA